MSITSKLYGERNNSTVDGIYRARVEDITDPEKIGRVRVRVPQFHGTTENGLKSSELPWATPITITGTGYDHGSILVPDIGDYVFVMFENGNRSTPVYLGGCYGIGPTAPKVYGQMNATSPNSEGLYNNGSWKGYPNLVETPLEVYNTSGTPTGKVVYKSPKGAEIYINDQDEAESLNIIDRIGQSIMMYSPVTSDKNQSNQSKRLKAKSADPDEDNPAMDPTTVCVDGKAYIILKDASGQEIKFTSSGSSSKLELLGLNDIGITINSSNIVINSNSSTNITVNKDGTVSIDSSNVAVEAKNVTLTGTTGMVIKANPLRIVGDMEIWDGVPE